MIDRVEAEESYGEYPYEPEEYCNLCDRYVPRNFLCGDYEFCEYYEEGEDE